MELAGEMFDVRAMCEMLASASRPQETEWDYRDERGILVCSKCGEDKEILKPVKSGDHEMSLIFGRECRCMREAREKREQEEKERRAREVIIKLHKYSMMDQRLAGATFEATEVTEENRRVVDLAKRYAEKFDKMEEVNQGLLFWGKPGTGKSHLAACIANALMDRGVSVVMTSCIRLMDELFHSETAEEDILRRLNMAQLLILDDLGAERGTQYAMEKVYNIIDARYRACKPLIVTTNLSKMEMQKENETSKGRVYSRVMEICYPVQFDGIEWRKRITKGKADSVRELLEGDE